MCVLPRGPMFAAATHTYTQPANMTYPDMIICLAVYFAACFPHDTARATTAFCKQCGALGYKTPKNARQFITNWASRVTPDGYIVRRAHLAGRRKKLTPQMVSRAYNAIVGWREAGRTRPYTSHEELLESCPEVQQVLSDTGLSLSTLLKAIRDKHRRFGRHTLTVRWSLTDENKRERSRCAQISRPVRPATSCGWCTSMPSQSR
jgi:hypothetical protein